MITINLYIEVYHCFNPKSRQHLNQEINIKQQ
jgi:hypothetical protein